MVYRFESGWWLAWLADQLALENAGKPTELVPDHAWDLGDIRISRKRKAPLLFVRRLCAEDVRSALIAALDRRSGRSGGILLTTTRHALEASTIPGSHRLMAMVDNLTSNATSFSPERGPDPKGSSWDGLPKRWGRRRSISPWNAQR